MEMNVAKEEYSIELNINVCASLKSKIFLEPG